MMNAAAATSPSANSRSKHKPFSRQVTPAPGHFSSSFISSSSPSKHPLLGLSLASEKSDHHLHHPQLPPSPCAGQCASCRESGVREMLAALALMCLLSLLTAFLALFFLQRTTPVITVSTSTSDGGGEDALGKGLLSHGVTQTRLSSLNMKEYLKVSQISLSLSTLTISLNLCCLFVCCIQFLSAAKLLKTPQGVKR